MSGAAEEAQPLAGNAEPAGSVSADVPAAPGDTGSLKPEDDTDAFQKKRVSFGVEEAGPVAGEEVAKKGEKSAPETATLEEWLDPFAVPVPGGINVAISSHGRVSGASSLFSGDIEVMAMRSLSFWRSHLTGELFFFIVSVLSLGIVPLLCFWHPPLLCSVRYIRAPDDEAEYALVESLDRVFSFAIVECVDPSSPESGWVPLHKQHTETRPRVPRSFMWHSERFWWNPAKGTWLRYRFDITAPISSLHRHGAACSMEGFFGTTGGKAGALTTFERRFLTYGTNLVRVEVPSFLSLLLKELLRPFFIFILFSFGIWVWRDYWQYGIVVLSLSIISLAFATHLTWKNHKSIKKLAETQCVVKQLAAEVDDNEAAVVLKAWDAPSSTLMPGDLVQVEAGMVLPCDMLLLAGQCVMNESMLTGESAPVLKTSLPLNTPPDARINPDAEADSKYQLLSGTSVLQARAMSSPPSKVPHWNHVWSWLQGKPDTANPAPCVWNLAPQPDSEDSKHKRAGLPVVAMVVGTGFATAKGGLVRSILYARPSSYEFQRNLYYFIFNLFLLWVVGAAVTIAFQAGTTPANEVVASVLDLMTVAISPALPLALSIGISTAFGRLGKNGIFCISPARIINAGRVNTLCFDKTGTLTRDGLTMSGVLPVTGSVPPQQRQQAQGGTAKEGSEAPGSEAALQQQGTPAVSFGEFESDMRKLYRSGLAAGAPDASSSAAGPDVASPPRHPSLPSPDPHTLLTQVLASCHSLSLLFPDPPHSADDESETGAETAAEAGGKGGKGLRALAVSALDQLQELAKGGSRRDGSKGKGKAGAEEKEEEAEEEDADFVGLDGRLSRLIGDPLEVQAFKASGWRILQRPEDAEKEEIAARKARARIRASLRALEVPEEAAVVVIDAQDPGATEVQGTGEALGEEDTAIIEAQHTAKVPGEETANTEAQDREEGAGEGDEGTPAATSVAIGAAVSSSPSVDMDPYAHIWSHPSVPPFADTILFPPALQDASSEPGGGEGGSKGAGGGAGERGVGPGEAAVVPGASSMLVVVRRLGFDSEIRRMGVVVAHHPVPVPGEEPLDEGSSGYASSMRVGGSTRIGGGSMREDGAIGRAASSLGASRRGAAGSLKGSLSLLVKGAPETLKPLCVASSLPADFEARLHEISLSGNRVLAAAHRPLPDLTLAEAMTASRGVLEQGLVFVGFLVLENELKAETVGFLEAFDAAGLRSIMVTGDNPRTAIAVARKCGPYFLLGRRTTLLLDCPAWETRDSSTREPPGLPTPATPSAAQEPSTQQGPGTSVGEVGAKVEAGGEGESKEGKGVGSGSGGGWDWDPKKTNCVLWEVSGDGERSVPLDDVLARGTPSYQQPAVAQGEGGDAKLVSEGVEAHAAAGGVGGALLGVEKGDDLEAGQLARRLGSALAGVDVVVTGRAFEALKLHHDSSTLPAPDSNVALGHDEKRGVLPSILGRLKHLFGGKGPRGSEVEKGQPGGSGGGGKSPASPLEVVLARAGIFARMSSPNKQDLMECLRDLGYSVCMTGDGANDSRALKTADVGVSIAAKPPSKRSPVTRRKKQQQHQQDEAGAERLASSSISSMPLARSSRTLGHGSKGPAGGDAAVGSRRDGGVRKGPKLGGLAVRDFGLKLGKRPQDLEAPSTDESVSAAPSIAAPFSTSQSTIGAVVEVLREGRCSLVSAVTIFKYMFFYGIIQTLALLVLYPFSLELTNAMYFWSDLGLAFPLIVLMPAISPKLALTRGIPESNLLSPPVLVSAYGHAAIIIGFTLAASFFTRSQPWFVYADPEAPDFDPQINIQTTRSFQFSSFQYVFLAVALSQSFGKFRVHLYECRLLVLLMAVQFTINSVFVLAPTAGINSAFGFYDMSPYTTFNYEFWALALSFGLAVCVFERFAIRHTSGEPEVLPVSRKEQQRLLELGSKGGSQQEPTRRTFFQRLRKVWEDSGEWFFPASIAWIGPKPRYAVIRKQVDGTWDEVTL